MFFSSDASIQHQIQDYILGFMDGITVSPSIAAGMVASGASRETVLTTILAETVAGSLSMALADGMSVDGSERKDDAFRSAIRTGIGYMVGSSISLIAYLLAKDVVRGFQLSILLNLIALIVFGGVRGRFLNEPVLKSIVKMVGIGGVTMLITFLVLRQV